MIPEAAVAAVTPEEISRASDLFDVVKQLRLRLTSISEEVLDRAFDTHVQGVLEKLEKRLPHVEIENAKKVEVVMAKHGLCDAAFQQVILLCQSISPALGDVLKEIRSIHSSFLAELQSTSNDFVRNLEEQKQYCNATRRDMQNVEDECKQLMDATALLDREAEESNQTILDLRQQLRDALAEVNAVKASGRLGSSARKKPQSSTATVEVPPVFDTSLTYQDAQGRRLFDNMKKEDALRGVRNKQPSAAGSSAGLSRSGKLLVQSLTTPTRGVGSADNKSDSGAFMRSTASSMANCTPPPPPTFGSSSQWLLGFRAELQAVIDADKVRTLSLHECRESIAAVYETKAAADARAASRGSGGHAHVSSVSGTVYHTDTMEMHVYRGLEKKYGLRSLAVDHAAMLLTSVRLYSETETDIELFYKIFRNDVEEEFRLVQNELRKSVKDLMMVQLMNKFPNKDQSTLESLLTAKMDGTILENEYTDIVNYLYNSKDATTLRLLLRSEANRIKEEKYLTGEDEDEDAIGDDEVKHVASVGKKSATGGTTRRNSASMGSGTRRLSYENKKLGFERKVPLSMRKESIARSKQEHFQAVKDNFDLPFDVFMKCVLEFQMSAHENYLAGFKHIFRHYDDDGDGVLTSEQFRKCYMRLRTHGADAPIARVSFADDDGDAEKGSGMVANRWSKQEENAFLGLLSIIDPAETDRVTFSAAAACLNKIGRKAHPSPFSSNKK